MLPDMGGFPRQIGGKVKQKKRQRFSILAEDTVLPTADIC